MIDSLNRQYAIDGHVVFTGAQGGMVKAEVSNSLATAQVYLHGAHITAFQPHTTEQPLLWMSGRTMLQPGKAIRGGIPICWPWFGPHPDDSSKPQHGYARISPWTMMSSAALEDGSTQLRLRMNADAPARGPWPDAVELELCVTVGSRLRIELISRNRHSEIVTIGSALHSYFNIGDIDRVSVAGLDGRDYLDQPDQYRRKRQNGPITIDAEVDRIYLDTADECVLTDPVLSRRIHIAKHGSNSTVVWNPWIDKAKRMTDFPDDGYRTMLCIETCNTRDDVRQLAPGCEHRLVQIISVAD